MALKPIMTVSMENSESRRQTDVEQEQGRESEKVITELRDEVARSMRCLGRQQLDVLPDDQLIPTLRDYFDQPASLGHFESLVRPPQEGDGKKPPLTLDQIEADPKLYDRFKNYLLDKLPEAKQEEWEDKLEDERTGRAAARRLMEHLVKPDVGVTLGFHTSTQEQGDKLEIKPKKMDTTYLSDGRETRTGEQDKFNVWYSRGGQQLFRYQNEWPTFIYLVEVGRGDDAGARRIAPERDAFLSRRPLPIRHLIRLAGESGDAAVAEETMKRLGLEFEK